MNNNYLKIIFVIDESGSMEGTESDVIGGFNNFIDQQKSQLYGKITVSLYKFNTEGYRIFNDLPLSEIRPLTIADYNPGGLTALYDTIGLAVTDANKQRHSAESSEPNLVLMVIITDGQENASRIYSSQIIKELISDREKNKNWQFIYLGTDLGSFADADSMGIKLKASSSKNNLRDKFNVVSEHTMFFRMTDPNEFNDQMMEDFISDLED